MPTIQETIDSGCWEHCPRKEQFVRMARENITLEEVEELYRFLQGEVPEGFFISAMPTLSPDQAFSVIYYLQEGMHIIPDKYEKCRKPGCNELFDSENEGCLALYCDGCGCQYSGGYDPEESEDSCNGCPLVVGDAEVLPDLKEEV